MAGGMALAPRRSVLDRVEGAIAAVNGRWHKLISWIFVAVVIAHWAEHLVQAFQIFVLDWPRPKALGAVGYLYPQLVKSEGLHYGYAIVMLAGLVLLRPGFVGRARRWWDVALVLQFWHHIEHLLLLGQATFHANLLGEPVPTSIAQFFFPRVELHLFYNVIVTVPMVIAMFYHRYPSVAEAKQATCTCAARRPALAA